jgi:hypothetical protein
MPRYNSYAPFERKPLNQDNKIKEKLTDVNSFVSCPAGSVLDTVNPQPSTSKPCHCVNPDGTYKSKWIYIDGAC